MDFHKKKMGHYKKALILSEKGKDPFKQLILSSKMELLSLKERGIKEVRILSTGGCASCKKQNGKIYSIDEAIKKMPLPNKNCSFHLYPENRNYSSCRCTYVPNGRFI